jgi:hypothetical protein
MKTDISSFERVEDFKYLGAALTYQTYIQEEIKSRLESRNAGYHLVQNVLSYSLVNKNLKIKVYKTIVLLVVLYGCETWLLTLREGLRVFENRVLWRTFGPKRDKLTGEWRILHNEEFNDLYSLPNIVGHKIENEMGEACRVDGGGESRVQGFGVET